MTLRCARTARSSQRRISASSQIWARCYCRHQMTSERVAIEADITKWLRRQVREERFRRTVNDRRERGNEIKMNEDARHRCTRARELGKLAGNNRIPTIRFSRIRVPRRASATWNATANEATKCRYRANALRCAHVRRDGARTLARERYAFNGPTSRTWRVSTTAAIVSWHWHCRSRTRRQLMSVTRVIRRSLAIRAIYKLLLSFLEYNRMMIEEQSRIFQSKSDGRCRAAHKSQMLPCVRNIVILLDFTNLDGSDPFCPSLSLSLSYSRLSGDIFAALSVFIFFPLPMPLQFRRARNMKYRAISISSASTSAEILIVSLQECTPCREMQRTEERERDARKP